MSLTIADVLKLPSLSRARLVAGEKALTRVVTSVSVLEYAQDTPLLTDMFESIQFRGSELVITGFTNIKDDVQAQLNAIRMSCAVGEVGMILYYVGVFIPKLDARLVELADELDFALILMPENDKTLRYSEVITEVVEAVQKERARDDYFIPDVLEQIARLPPQRRSMDVLLRMISDRTHATLLLADTYWKVLNWANWPVSQEEPDLRVLEAFRVGAGLPGIRHAVVSGGRGPDMNLLIRGLNAEFSEEAARQCVETVQLFVNIWSERHGEAGISELIRAIIRDEPVKMRRLAGLFGIDVSSIHTMWVLRPDAPDPGHQRRLSELAREVIAPHCRTVIADGYEDDVIVFLEDPALGQNAAWLASELLEAMQQSGLWAKLFISPYSLTTSDARAAYLLFCGHGAAAARIWPTKRALTLEEIKFAVRCSEILAKGEEEIDRRLRILAPIQGEKELLATLSTYLLDGDMSVTRTAQKLYLHKNTVKYRLGRLCEKLGSPVSKMPEAAALYLAMALKRLLAN